MDPSDLGDFVIAKSLTEPLFHLAVVVDDFESGVTHIIRGEDHLANTPRHILLQAALGAPRPLARRLPTLRGRRLSAPAWQLRTAAVRRPGVGPGTGRGASSSFLERLISLIRIPGLHGIRMSERANFARKGHCFPGSSVLILIYVRSIPWIQTHDPCFYADGFCRNLL